MDRPKNEAPQPITEGKTGKQQQEPLGDPKTNAWEPPETKDNDDKEEESDDS
jgi:hypothetical protein